MTTPERSIDVSPMIWGSGLGVRQDGPDGPDGPDFQLGKHIPPRPLCMHCFTTEYWCGFASELHDELLT